MWLRSQICEQCHWKGVAMCYTRWTSTFSGGTVEFHNIKNGHRGGTKPMLLMLDCFTGHLWTTKWSTSTFAGHDARQVGKICDLNHSRNGSQFPKMTRNLWEQTISSENLHENLHDVVKIMISISSMLLWAFRDVSNPWSLSIPSNPERDRQVWELHRPARDCAGAASAARYAVLEATGAHAGAQEIKHEARLNAKASCQRWVEQKLQNPNRNKACHVFFRAFFWEKARV